MRSDGIRACSRTAGFAPPRHSRTCIAFDELPDENWAIAAKPLDVEWRGFSGNILRRVSS